MQPKYRIRQVTVGVRVEYHVETYQSPGGWFDEAIFGFEPMARQEVQQRAKDAANFQASTFYFTDQGAPMIYKEE